MTCGLRCDVVRPIFARGEPLIPADLVVVSGLRGDTADIADAYRARGVPVLVLELPRLRTAIMFGRVGLYPEHLAALPMRVGNVAQVHGVLRASRKDRQRVLLCGQVPHDTAHGASQDELDSLYISATRILRAQFPLARLVFRPHPHNDEHVSTRLRESVDHVEMPADMPLRRALRNALAVVSFNSTTGWDAIMAGVPAVYIAPNTRTVSWGEYGSALGAPLQVLCESARRVALLRAAACEWTFAQCAAGVPLQCHLGAQEWPAAQLVTLDEPEAHPCPQH